MIRNRPFPSCFEPHYERETKYQVFSIKISFRSYANKTIFHGPLGLCITHIQRSTLPSLQSRRLQDLATLMYKVKYGSVPSNISDILSVKSSKDYLKNEDFR